MSTPAPELWQRFSRSTREHAILVLDPEGILIGWEGAAHELLGYERDEVLGRHAAFIFTPEDRAEDVDALEFAIASFDSRAEDERWHLRKDGTRIWLSGTLEALRDEAGNLLGFIKLVRDRTDARMRMEELELEAEAARLGRDRTVQFTRTLGHEMRNPLAPLLNSAAILKRVSDDPRVHKAAGLIENQVAALSRMAEDLVSIARAESGQLELRKAAVDMREAVQEAVTGLEDAARGKGVRLEFLRPRLPLTVSLDRTRFAQVLLNILGNGIKYTPAGGHVWCKLTREPEEVVLRVQDTGIGIDPAVLPRIFELFSREQHAVERDPGGLGIGLSIARQVVALHGGSIQARSAGHGRGAEFTIRLPAVAGPAVAEPGAAG